MRLKAFPLVSLVAGLAIAAAAAACSAARGQSSSALEDDAGDGGMPFQPDPPSVYVAKVKNVLVGLPPTDDEVKQVEADPSQLASLIAGWQALPQYQTKTLRFFELAFQQTQISQVDFADQAYPRQVDVNGATTPLLVENAQESFARTMLDLLVQKHQPLTTAMTTHQVMMTTALKELYAFLDVWEVSDTTANPSNVAVVDHLRQQFPQLAINVGAKQGPIDPSQSADPSSPDFMHWYDPDVGTLADANVPGCNVDPIVFSGRDANALTLHLLLYGGLTGWTGTGGARCLQYGGSPQASQLQAGDFGDWTLVTIRPPASGEATTPFYDLPSLRTATTLVLSLPRAGFFSTPAFFANWQTNTSNTMRVTLNQALIVALGSSIDGTDMTVPTSTPGLDTTHANQAACYTCHRLLDPSRSILASAWSWNYHAQLDQTYGAQPGLFAFRGVVKPVKSIDDFAAALASHPYLPGAWVQKLCFYANSQECVPTDPVFARIESDFESSSFDWNGLVKELLSSPIVTHASETLTAQQGGEVVAVSRRDHLCAALDARLGFSDVCGLSAATPRAYAQTTVPEIAAGLPSDGYGRGSTAPVLPNDPTLFFRAGTENMCESLAAQVIDVPQGKRQPGVEQWSSANPSAAIADFVGIVMALTPSDPRYAKAVSILTDHFDQARAQQGITPTAALQSTFTAACLAPSAVSIGM